jgi:WD40 repeat protein
VLISRRDRYITLHNALWDTNNSAQPNSNDVSDNIASPITSYKLINSNTEAIIAPTSLVFSHSGTRFFAGHQNRIAPFDVERPDVDPVQIPTIPAKRSKRKGGGRGFKGWISALSLSPPSTLSQGGLLAAGSRTRHVGIYDAISNEEVTTFDLKGTVDMELGQKTGNGVSHLKYSPCGTYLYVAERQSDILLIYDVRKFSLALGYCTGRKALTTQKLGFDVWNRGVSPYEGETLSHEIWAGGTDGVIRVWRDPYLKEGAVEADEVVQIGEGNAPVVETMVHKLGNLAVAACGRMQVNDDESESEGMGRRRGGTLSPKFREWGSLEILGLH